MNTKTTCKLVLDILMFFCLLLLMGYHLWGETFHKILGISMLFLVLLHQILNIHWYKSLFKGKYSLYRIFVFCCIFLLLSALLAQGYSGIRMAQDFFPSLAQFGNMSLARKLHFPGSHWGFLLISFHMGLYWNTIKNYGKKILPVNLPPYIKRCSFFPGICFSLYGIWAFHTRNFTDYLFVRTEFVMLDYEEGALLFYTDMLAIMGLFILLARICSKIIQKIN